jgi:uncharacterized protein YqeY
MNLAERIDEDIKTAMKARDKDRLETVRNIKKVIIEARAAKGAGSVLTDDETLKIIQKLAKQGRESAAIYSQQERPDLYEAEMVQVAILESYLPAKLSDEELTAAVKAILEKTGATSIKDMGKVMGLASKELAGKADGKDIADKVKVLLQ